MDLWQLSENNRARQAAALTWMDRLTPPHALAWVERAAAPDLSLAWLAVRSLFAQQMLPEGGEADLLLCRDPLGKPYLYWRGDLALWAEAHGLDSRHCHITNTHDGGAHLILVAYEERLAGLGIDLVSLPRLRGAGRDAAYLRRFARHFMGEEEWRAFETAVEEEDEEKIRLRLSAHFSLMEAASKALGTGLKIGAGMGHAASLRKQALGARRIEPEVEMLFDETARSRMHALGAQRIEAHWAASEDYLASVVLLWRD